MNKITRKSLLYKSGVEYADYGLNHAEGCSHGCTFPCYAMMIKKRCGVVKTYQEWIEPKIVENTLELLDKEIPKLKDKIRCVFMCFMTDPFMYQQREVEDLTLRVLKRLNEDNIKAILISKGLYPQKLANQSIYGNINEYGSTIVSLSEEFRRRYEPGASPIKERIERLKKLSKSGLKTWVSMEPYPTPNIITQDVNEILNAVSFTNKIVFGKWNYNKLTSEFKFHKEFYDSMAEEVIKFCNKKGIELHIKEGTITEKKFNRLRRDLVLDENFARNVFGSDASLF